MANSRLWSIVLGGLLEDGFPHLPTLAKALRGNLPVPREVRIFLAEQIDDGQLKRKGKGRGRPRALNTEEQMVQDFFMDAFFSRELEIAQKLPKSRRPPNMAPYDIALEATATLLRSTYGMRVTEEAIAKRIKSRKKRSISGEGYGILK